LSLPPDFVEIKIHFDSAETPVICRGLEFLATLSTRAIIKKCRHSFENLGFY